MFLSFLKIFHALLTLLFHKSNLSQILPCIFLETFIHFKFLETRPFSLNLSVHCITNTSITQSRLTVMCKAVLELFEVKEIK